MSVASPCIGICKLDSQGICQGCLRNQEEIAKWLQMSDGGKSAVYLLLEERRKQRRRQLEAQTS